MNFYPRLEGRNIAAGYCILKEAGFNVIDWVTKWRFAYDKPSLENHFSPPQKMILQVFY